MTDKYFESLPKVHTTYANIIKSLLPIGEHAKVEKDALPQASYHVNELQIDKDNLQEYRKICGFYDNGFVPVTYFAVLSQALQMNMMVKEPFPFAMLGLVHIENTVIQHRPVLDTETVSMVVRFDNLKDHDKGQQFDFVTTVLSGEETIWEGTSTYLSRSRQKQGGKKTSKPKTDSQPHIIEEDFCRVFEVPEDIGRRYAFVSGDFNLIHLHSLSARAFGFPKAIAHGMWSKAKCLAQIQDLPRAYRVDVSFKLPIFLPSEVKLVAENLNKLEQLSDDVNFHFALYQAKTEKPHLFGTIRPTTVIEPLFTEEDVDGL